MKELEEILKKISEVRKLIQALRNEKGIVLPVAMMLAALVAVMGSAAVVTSRTDMKISGNYKNSEEAFFIAQAGTEHARAVFGAMNTTSANTTSFSDELASVIGGNGTLDGYAGTTDDAPIANAAVGNGSYTVYLTNDSLDGYSNQTDSNKMVMLTSIGTGLNGSEAIVELTVSAFDLFPPPGTITLLGSNASFTGGNGNAKELHGADQCATDPMGVTRPVIAISDSTDLFTVKNSVNSSKPKTYDAMDMYGAIMNAQARPDLITAAIPASTVLSTKSTYGIDMLNPAELNGLVYYIERVADTVAPSGSSTSTAYVGTPSDPKIVIVKGNFSLNGSGAGILVVTGELVFNGNVDYEGLILVIGEGYMRRNGGGNGKISGAIIVADTEGPDGIAGTTDDILQNPIFDTGGGGNSNISYCSTAINQALSVIVPRPVAFKHIM